MSTNCVGPHQKRDRHNEQHDEKTTCSNDDRVARRVCTPTNCRGHDVGETAKNKLGPELNGLDGRKAGTVEAGTYSQGMRDSGITWNEQAFREFVSNPAAKVPGTTMLLSVRDEKEMGDLWAYLKQFGADGKKKSQ